MRKQKTKLLLNLTIKKITSDLDDLKFNTAVSQLMIFVNHLTTLKELDKKVINHFLILLNPFAPHITEEINEKLGNSIITTQKWPKHDEDLIINQNITIAVQINGKTRGTIETEPNSNQNDTIEKIKATKIWQKYLSDEIEIKKIIYIQNKIINIIAS